MYVRVVIKTFPNLYLFYRDYRLQTIEPSQKWKSCYRPFTFLLHRNVIIVCQAECDRPGLLLYPLTSWCYLPNTQVCTHPTAGATCQTLRYVPSHQLVLPAKHSGMYPLTSWCYLPNTQILSSSFFVRLKHYSTVLPTYSWDSCWGMIIYSR